MSPVSAALCNETGSNGPESSAFWEERWLVAVGLHVDAYFERSPEEMKPCRIYTTFQNTCEKRLYHTLIHTQTNQACESGQIFRVWFLSSLCSTEEHLVSPSPPSKANAILPSHTHKRGLLGIPNL